MTDSKFPELLEGSGDAETQLWKTLGEAEFEQPSARLRQEFYKNLEQASKPGVVAKLRNVLGFSGNAGWLTAAACVLVGVGAGVGAGHLDPATSADTGRLEALEQNVSLLHRSLVLDRLQNEQPGKRLRGVIDAAHLVQDDAAIASKLLQLAASDRVNSIRSAAVESLGSQLSSPAVGAQLMNMLGNTESPLVQLALIDVVLRNGSDEQIDQLLTLATDEQLYPDLQRHVLTTLERI